jgi:hypothetical protein
MDLDYEFVSYPTRTLDLATYIRGMKSRWRDTLRSSLQP